MALTFALAGNPNCGKTTLFNEWTGSTAHVGNWSGVTIDRKEGHIRKLSDDIRVIDLPGIYSLSPYTPEEVVARNYLVDEQPDVIVNIVDATNLPRNLFLTTQLLELDLPVVIALNMTDELRQRGDVIDYEAMRAALGVPVVPISALRGEGLTELIDIARKAAALKRAGKSVLMDSALSEPLQQAEKLLKEASISSSVFHAVKVLEGDSLILADTRLVSKNAALTAVQATVSKRQGVKESAESAVAALRYQWVAMHIQPLVRQKKPSHQANTSDKIDHWLTHPWLGIPLFLGFMFLMFHLTFGETLFGIGSIPGPGVWLQGLTEIPIVALGDWLTTSLAAAGASDWVLGLLVEGIVGGVGAVLSFMPQIMMLFLFLSILEDSGYMARAAYIMDRILRRFGLSGRAFLPMLMGFGCSVPAMMGTRTLETEKDRRLTRILIPYMSCGAKAPIWAIFAAALFPQKADVVVFCMYLLGILTAVVSAIILKKVLFKASAAPLIMELPPYRMPKAKNSLLLMWEKLREYVVRAGTILLVSAIAIWFLSSFTWSLDRVEAGSAESILGAIGSVILWFFKPLGFVNGPDGWKAAVAILTGLLAKEAVVSTLGVLYNPGIGDALEDEGAQSALLASLATAFTPLAALSYMAFNLLSIPCMAAVAAMRAESRSAKWTAITICIWVGTAWTVSFLIFNIGTLLGF